MTTFIGKIFRKIGDLLLKLFNKEFLVFLFFLVLSSLYWVLSVLNETTEREIEVKAKIVGVPKNVVLFGDSIRTLRVVVRDKGYMIYTYQTRNGVPMMKFLFSAYAQNKDRFVIPSQDIHKQLSSLLYNSTRIVSIKPDKLECAYNFGQNKLVPVALSGKVTPSNAYSLAKVEFSPDSVSVYSSADVLKGIHAVYTQKQNISNVTDTIRKTVTLVGKDGMKIRPNQVTMTVYTDVMVEGVVTVPVRVVNIPAGKMMRLFPSKVNVRYVVRAAKYNDVTADQFDVIADYSLTNEGQEDKCQLRLYRSPFEVKNARIEQPIVDYLIEGK